MGCWGRGGGVNTPEPDCQLLTAGAVSGECLAETIKYYQEVREEWGIITMISVSTLFRVILNNSLALGPRKWLLGTGWLAIPHLEQHDIQQIVFGNTKETQQILKM